MIQGFAILMGFYFVGQVIAVLTRIPIPGNVLGMVLLLLSLKFRIIKLGDVEDASDLLLDNLMFLFLPTTVAIMLYFDIILKSWPVMLGVTIVSTFIVAFIVGKIADGPKRGDENDL